MAEYQPQNIPTPQEYKINYVYQRPKLIKPGKEMRREQMEDYTQPYNEINEGKYESKEYNDMKEINREINEAKMLSGGTHATLFNGDTLNVSADEDSVDEEKHDNGGTQAGIERYKRAQRDTDIPDLSSFDFNNNALAGSDVLPTNTRKPMKDFESEFRQRSNNLRKSRDSSYSGDYSGSQESLLANGYGVPALPRPNEYKYEKEFKNNGNDSGSMNDMSDSDGSIMSEISSHLNLRDDSIDSVDNKPTLEDLVKRMKGINRTNSSIKDFRAKNKWNPTTGRGNKLKGIKLMTNSLSSIRESQIPYKQPNRSYKGDAVNLVRSGNATMVKIINQYQP